MAYVKRILANYTDWCFRCFTDTFVSTSLLEGGGLEAALLTNRYGMGKIARLTDDVLYGARAGFIFGVSGRLMLIFVRLTLCWAIGQSDSAQKRIRCQ